MMQTPPLKDKRYHLTVGTILAVVLLHALGNPMNGEQMTFLTLTVAAFMGQSQYGQTKRATEAAKNGK